MEGSLVRYLKRYPVVTFLRVLSELRRGKKETCWMWYVFPQLRGLARSRKTFVFGITGEEEARQYLNHPILGERLKACCETLLKNTDKTAEEIFGENDAKKLFASMTLFAWISEENSVFHKVLDRYFEGERDRVTLGLLSGKILDATVLKYGIFGR